MRITLIDVNSAFLHGALKEKCILRFLSDLKFTLDRIRFASEGHYMILNGLQEYGLGDLQMQSWLSNRDF